MCARVQCVCVSLYIYIYIYGNVCARVQHAYVVNEGRNLHVVVYNARVFKWVGYVQYASACMQRTCTNTCISFLALFFFLSFFLFFFGL